MDIEIVLAIANLALLFWIKRYLQKKIDRIHQRYVDLGADWSRACKGVCKELEKKLEAEHIKIKLAEKMADRAFSLASSANLACMHIQRTLAVRPQFATKKQMMSNELAQKQVQETITGQETKTEVDYSDIDWMYSALDEEERKIVDNAREIAYRRKLEA